MGKANSEQRAVSVEQLRRFRPAHCLLLTFLLLTGCSLTPESQSLIAGRSVNITAWGINATTPYGLFNVGYIQYQRNPKENLDPAEPQLPGKILE